jgi:hypothetical protein
MQGQLELSDKCVTVASLIRCDEGGSLAGEADCQTFRLRDAIHEHWAPHILFAFMAHRGTGSFARDRLCVQTFLDSLGKEINDPLSRIGSKIARMQAGADKR